MSIHNKKFICFMLILAISLAVINAAQIQHDYSFGTVFLNPMGNTGGIPMNPKRTDTHKPYGTIQGSVNAEGDYLESYEHDNFWTGNTGAVGEGMYSDHEMIGLGGVWAMPMWDSESRDILSIQLDATCENGFFFVSQSNPSYKRPFELYVVPIAHVYEKHWEETGRWINKKNHYRWNRKSGKSRYGKILTLGEYDNSVTVSYVGLVPDKDQRLNMAKANTFAGNIDDVFDSGVPNDLPRLYFDLVLGLPGKVENDILKMPDGREYPLVEASDYSATVTLTLVARCGNQESVPITVTIPFSGSYESGKEGVLQPDTVSMYVHPAASAGNLNLKNYGRQQIASLEIMSTKTYAQHALDPRVSTVPDPVPSYAIFLSSESDPYVKGTPFKLVKENLGYDVKLNPYNSVDYKVILIDNVTFDEKTYSGEDCITNGVNVTASNVGYVSGQTQDLKQKYSFMMLPHNEDFYYSHSKDVRSFNFSGTAYIEITDNSTYLMESGRYTGSVFVHVINI